MPWIVAVTKPLSEPVVATLLRQRGFDAYCPLARVTKRHARKTTEVLEPLFPRYILVRDHREIDVVRRMFGISSVIMSGDKIARVPDAVVRQIQERETDGAVTIDDKLAMLKNGDAVVVEGGPFAGVSGVFGTMKGKDRCIILIASATVELNVRDLAA